MEKSGVANRAALLEKSRFSAAEIAETLADLERQILVHLASGATNREIARRVNLSERTVRRRVIRVYGKLRVSDRVDAALYAERHGLRTASQPASGRPDD